MQGLSDKKLLGEMSPHHARDSLEDKNGSWSWCGMKGYIDVDKWKW